MKNLSLYYRDERLNLVTPLIISVVVTMFLFFIDEGYYSFEWMTKPWNYYPFAVYVSGFALGQLIVASFLFRRLNGLVNTLTVCVLGIPAGAVVSLVLICFIGILSLIFGWT